MNKKDFFVTVVLVFVSVLVYFALGKEGPMPKSPLASNEKADSVIETSNIPNAVLLKSNRE